MFLAFGRRMGSSTRGAAWFFQRLAAGLACFSFGGACSGGFKDQDSAGPRYTSFRASTLQWREEGDGDAGDGDAPSEEEPPLLSPERALEEAEIVQVIDEHLYVLSRDKGLTILNIADPAQLRLVGRFETQTEPLEMYVSDDVVTIVSNEWEWGPYRPGGSIPEYLASHVTTVDVSDPAVPRELRRFEVPGVAKETRKVGDVLYLVTYEGQGCEGCAVDSNTGVSSIDLSDPSAPVFVDRVFFQGITSAEPVVSVSPERIYLADRTMGALHVVDISDPTGDLEPGASIDAGLSIGSAWQIDERGGVLRLARQSSRLESLRLDTYQVGSSTEFTLLGSVELDLPGEEEVVSMKFDGERAFVSSAERYGLEAGGTFSAIDWSNSAAPVLAGRFSTQDVLRYLHVDADRIFALGSSHATYVGSLSASLIDISDLSSPGPLATVAISSQGNFVEQTQRLNRAFTIDEERGLVYVPYSGAASGLDPCEDPGSGVQVLSLGSDTLTSQGFVPRGAARVFRNDETLVAMTDRQIRTYDAGDLTKPSVLGSYDVVQNTSFVLPLPGGVLRLNDWGADYAPHADLVTAQTDVEFPFSALGGSRPCVDGGSSSSSWEGASSYFSWGGPILRHGNHAYGVLVAWRDERYFARVVTFDVSEEGSPSVVSTTDVVLDAPLEKFYLTDEALVLHVLSAGMSRFGYQYLAGSDELSWGEQTLVILSLADPALPEVASSLAITGERNEGHFGMWNTGVRVDTSGRFMGNEYDREGMLVSGDLLISQHSVSVGEGDRDITTWMDRLDLSDPTAPRFLEPINVPGEVIGYEATTQRIVTIDWQKLTWSTVVDPYCNAGFRPPKEGEDVCHFAVRRMNLLELRDDGAYLLDQEVLESAQAPGSELDGSLPIKIDSAAFDGERLFVIRQAGIEPPTLAVLRVDGEELKWSPAVTKFPGIGNSSDSQLSAQGGLAFNQGYFLTQTGEDPPVEIAAFPEYRCAFRLFEGHAYCARGPGGAARVEVAGVEP